ncbi:MAG TPA: energy-coupling factor transporter transmembrane component T [Nitrospirota bacterium]|jgi:cobalt/nickel transport system permease protein
MDISKVDYWATSGTSMMHRASVASKLLATASVIASVVVSRDLAGLAALYALILITVRAAGLPVVKVVLISLFPSLFAVLFAVSYASTGWVMPAVIILKALTAASSMVLLISTTPYTEVAGSLGRILPRVVADGMFMTYRSFFIMLEMLDHFIDALRLRGGFRPGRMFANAGNMGAGIGMLFIRSYDKSQRLYDVMSVRGYSGMLAPPVRFKGFGMVDMPYLAATGSFLLMLSAAAYKGVAAGFYPVAVLAFYLVFMEAARAWKI